MKIILIAMVAALLVGCETGALTTATTAKTKETAENPKPDFYVEHNARNGKYRWCFASGNCHPSFDNFNSYQEAYTDARGFFERAREREKVAVNWKRVEPRSAVSSRPSPRP